VASVIEVVYATVGGCQEVYATFPTLFKMKIYAAFFKLAKLFVRLIFLTNDSMFFNVLWSDGVLLVTTVAPSRFFQTKCLPFLEMKKPFSFMNCSIALQVFMVVASYRYRSNI
jgi:hypothetical protein